LDESVGKTCGGWSRYCSLFRPVYANLFSHDTNFRTNQFSIYESISLFFIIIDLPASYICSTARPAGRGGGGVAYSADGAARWDTGAGGAAGGYQAFDPDRRQAA
jgi:hypothetical protein